MNEMKPNETPFTHETHETPVTATPTHPPAAMPTGSVYPTPAQVALASPTTPTPPVETRRVGTFTMALCLIVVGALLLAHIFFPNMNILYIMQFAPVVLVFLGTELLIANLFYKDKKLRYDVLGIVISLFLIGGSLFVASIPEIRKVISSTNHMTYQLSREIESDAFERLEGIETVNTLTSYVDFNQWANYSESPTIAALPANTYVRLNIGLNGPFATKEEFANTCLAIKNKLQNTPYRIETCYFYDYINKDGWSYQGDERHSISLGGVFEQNWTVEQMLKNTNTQYWDREINSYVDEYEYQDRKLDLERYRYDEYGYSLYDDARTPVELPPETKNTVSAVSSATSSGVSSAASAQSTA